MLVLKYWGNSHNFVSTQVLLEQDNLSVLYPFIQQLLIECQLYSKYSSKGPKLIFQTLTHSRVQMYKSFFFLYKAQILIKHPISIKHQMMISSTGIGNKYIWMGATVCNCRYGDLRRVH